MKKYDHMTRHDVATLACEQMHWVSTLISVAKNSPHSETLLTIAEYLTDECYSNFDEIASEFE